MIRVSLAKDSGLQGRLKILRQKLGNLRPVMEKIGESVLKRNEEHFEKAKGAEIGGVDFGEGVSWSPLTEKYRKWKITHADQDWLMVLSGDLRASLKDKSAIGNIFEVSNNWVRVGTDLPQARYNRNLRPCVFILQDDINMITSNIYDEFKAILAGGLGRVKEKWLQKKGMGSF